MTTIAREFDPVTDANATPRVVEVTGGVDTHADTHTAAVVDSAGRVLGTAEFPTTAAGYRRLLGWLRSFENVGAGRNRGHRGLRGGLGPLPGRRDGGDG